MRIGGMGGVLAIAAARIVSVSEASARGTGRDVLGLARVSLRLNRNINVKPFREPRIAFSGVCTRRTQMGRSCVSLHPSIAPSGMRTGFSETLPSMPETMARSVCVPSEKRSDPIATMALAALRRTLPNVT